jgi:hypothetical protein
MWHRSLALPFRCGEPGIKNAPLHLLEKGAFTVEDTVEEEAQSGLLQAPWSIPLDHGSRDPRCAPGHSHPGIQHLSTLSEACIVPIPWNTTYCKMFVTHQQENFTMSIEFYRKQKTVYCNIIHLVSLLIDSAAGGVHRSGGGGDGMFWLLGFRFHLQLQPAHQLEGQVGDQGGDQPADEPDDAVDQREADDSPQARDQARDRA